MAEIYTLLATDSTGFSSLTPTVSQFSTYGKTNFVLYVVANPMGTTNADTFNLTLQESDVDTFPTAETFTVRLTTPSGTGSTAITQYDGSMVAGNAALLQKYNLLDANYSRYIQPKVTVAGTAGNFKNMRVFISYDQIKRTTIT